MNDIRTNGLMTKEDRLNNKVHVATKRAVFGDGIYTANNPSSFMKFGSVGLIVARLQGKSIRVPRRSFLNYETPKLEKNTIVGDKSAASLAMWPKSDLQHEFVLQSSSQCLPMIRYNRKFLTPSLFIGEGEAYILRFANSLRMVIDEIFNDGVIAISLSSSAAAEIPIAVAAAAAAAAPVTPAFSAFGKTFYGLQHSQPNFVVSASSAHGITQSFGTPRTPSLLGSANNIRNILHQ